MNNQEAPVSEGHKGILCHLHLTTTDTQRLCAVFRIHFATSFFLLQLFAICRRLTIPPGIYYNRPFSKVSYHQCCNKCSLLLPVLSLPETDLQTSSAVLVFAPVSRNPAGDFHLGPTSNFNSFPLLHFHTQPISSFP